MAKKHLWSILILLTIILLLVVHAVLANFPSLVGKDAPKKEMTPSPVAVRSTQTETVAEEKMTITEEVEPTEATLDESTTQCKGPDSMSVLVVGIDEQAQSDAIRLVRVDFIREKISVLSIPRDFYVAVVNMEDHGITEGRISATYGYGEKFYGQGKGIKALSENLTYNFGVNFDRFVVLDFSNIAEYIDQIGGVDIRLDQPVSDGNLYFPSGDNYMNGKTAVSFMRMRYFDDDFARMRRQSLVFRAFYRKVLSELSMYELSQLAIKGLTDESIRTNFNHEDIDPFICLATHIDGYDVQFIEIPKEMYWPFTTPAGATVQIPDDSVATFLKRVMEGDYQP